MPASHPEGDQIWIDWEVRVHTHDGPKYFATMFFAVTEILNTVRSKKEVQPHPEPELLSSSKAPTINTVCFTVRYLADVSVQWLYDCRDR